MRPNGTVSVGELQPLIKRKPCSSTFPPLPPPCYGLLNLLCWLLVPVQCPHLINNSLYNFTARSLPFWVFLSFLFLFSFICCFYSNNSWSLNFLTYKWKYGNIVVTDHSNLPASQSVFFAKLWLNTALSSSCSVIGWAARHSSQWKLLFVSLLLNRWLNLITGHCIAADNKRPLTALMLTHGHKFNKLNFWKTPAASCKQCVSKMCFISFLMMHLCRTIKYNQGYLCFKIVYKVHFQETGQKKLHTFFSIVLFKTICYTRRYRSASTDKDSQKEICERLDSISTI